MVELAAIDSQLSAVEVYDKVVFPTITGATAAP
jgi:hypothetical protein